MSRRHPVGIETALLGCSLRWSSPAPLGHLDCTLRAHLKYVVLILQVGAEVSLSFLVLLLSCSLLHLMYWTGNACGFQEES